MWNGASHVAPYRCPYTIMCRLRSVRIVFLVIVLLLGTYFALKQWRTGISKESVSVVTRIYQHGSPEIEDSSVMRSASKSWSENWLTHGPVTEWKIQRCLVQGLGTPVLLKVETRRKGKKYAEEWYINNGTVYAFHLAESP